MLFLLYKYNKELTALSKFSDDVKTHNLFSGILLPLTSSEVLSISSIDYENVAYTHQGWFTEDQKYFILGDEADEIERGGNTRTIIIDVTDLDDPKVYHFYYSPTPAIDHNGYVKGDTFFLANYTSGIRIIDISGISEKEINELGFFDTYPINNSTSFNGVWSVYPYFESGIISISDSNSGLFLVKKSQ